MAKDDGSEMVTWTGHGIRHQLEQRRRDVGSIFVSHHLRLAINLLSWIYSWSLNMTHTKWVTQKEK